MRKFLRKLLIPLHKYYISDLVRIGTATEIYEITARFYNEDLKPVYILRTKDNKLIEESEEFIVEYKGSI